MGLSPIALGDAYRRAGVTVEEEIDRRDINVCAYQGVRLAMRPAGNRKGLGCAIFGDRREERFS